MSLHPPAMYVLANSCAARASSQFLIKLFIFSSTDRYFVCLNAKGIATGIIPNVSSKGVFNWSACCQLLCEFHGREHSGPFFQIVCTKYQNIKIYALISWLTHSVASSDYRWYGVIKDDLILSSFKSYKKDFATNWGPLSEMILSIKPNHLYTLSSKSWAHWSAIKIVLQGMRITPFVWPWSTTAKIKSYPPKVGKSVIISMEQLAKGLVDFAPSKGKYDGWDGFWLILNCWQILHPCMYHLMNVCILGHQ